MGLDPKLVEKLYATRRVKGGYLAILAQASESDENGFAAKETYPQLKDKAAATIYQGFRNAAEKLLGDEWTQTLDILNSDDEVYVIFKDRIQLVAAAEGEK
jgi:hypothetical protein